MTAGENGIRAVFLDRDGVITEVNSTRVHYVNKPEDVYLLPGAAEAIAGLREAGYAVYIVTNQGGIGLRYMSRKDLAEIHSRLEALLAEKGSAVDDIVFCPHRPDAGCPCRKPKPGMILELAKRYDIDLKKSYMVGDRDSDIQAGAAAGTQTVRISGLRSGSGRKKNSVPADITAPSLLEAAVEIIRRLAESQNSGD